MSNGYKEGVQNFLEGARDFFTHDKKSNPGNYFSLENRIQRAKDRGNLAKATDLELKQEYGTSDPDKIAKMKAGQALLDYERNPEKAAGFGRKVQAAQERAFKASRDATAIALRNALNQQVMAGQPIDAGAAQAALAGATELDAEQQAQERATMNEAIRKATFGEGQRLVANLRGAQLPPTPMQQTAAKMGQGASKAALLFLADMADSQDPKGGGIPTSTESTA